MEHNKFVFINRYYWPDRSPTSVLLGDVSAEMAAAGNDVHVITSRQRYDDPHARLAAEESKEGVRIHRVWTSRFGRQNLAGRLMDYLTFYLSATWKLAGVAAKGDIVVAKTDPPLIGVAACLVARWRGAFLVNWLQDLYPEIAAVLGVRGIRGPLEVIFKYLRNASLRGARLNVTVDEEMAKRIAWQGIPDSKISVIHNWADGDSIQPLDQAENPLRTEWGLADKFIVGYAGNLGRIYDFEVLLKAAEKLSAHADIVFVLVGNGPQKAWVQETCKRRALERQVILKPPQPASRAGEVLALPDVHLISVRPGTEGCVMPSKLYAAMAAGRPVLYAGSLDGSAAKIIDREQFGFTLAAGDADGLADRIMKIRQFKDLRKEMGAKARAAFERDFDKKNGLDHWRKLLVSLAGEG